MIVTVSEKGQLVIPAQIRRNLGISAGTRLDITLEASGFTVSIDDARKTKSARDCIGIAKYAGKLISIEEMDAAKFSEKGD